MAKQTDGGAAEAQRKADEINAKGYIGHIENPDGDSHTLAAVTSEMTDEEKARPVAAPLRPAGTRDGQTQGSSSSPAATNTPDGTDTGK